MKKHLLILLFILTGGNISALNYNVTVPVGTKECYIAGEMNGWTQQVMQKVDETHYTIEIAIATTEQEYKYCSGPGWGYVENIPNGNNRTYSENDVVESWAAIYDPEVVATEVIYTVTVPEGTYCCYFAGAASNWQHTEMTKIDNTHFTLTLSTVLADDYKYCSGPGWEYEEYGADDQPISNRKYTESDVVVKWKAVFNPGITYQVIVPDGTNACYIAGEMNDWIQQPMEKVNDTSYSLTLANANDLQKYKYCSGPSWDYVELTEDGGDMADRTYSNNDIVEKWNSVWIPGTTILKTDNTLNLSAGRVDRYLAECQNILGRNIDVWIPDGYSVDKKYSVLYMHDGQMLFDATQTWNGQEWKVDETLGRLFQNNEIKNVIVVGIWNTDNRYSDYYPEKTLDYLPENIRTQKISDLGNDPKADEYLDFIVTDLKPFIDKTYSVYSDRFNTFIGGSSMGGLISWYAMCEYPGVFGAAICMSTHWADNSVDDTSIPDSFRKYLLDKMPLPADHKIYFDHGTVDLDANYGVHQLLVDTIMRYKGYDLDNFESNIFDNEGHNEIAWSDRFDIPVKFILKKNSETQISLIDDFSQDSYECDSVLTVKWTSVSVSNIKIEFSADNGETWNTVAEAVPAYLSMYNWVLPSNAMYECKIRISDVTNEDVNDETSGIFVIYNHLSKKIDPLMTVEYPVFMWPYNACYPDTKSTDDENINGKVGNACGPTLISNLLRYWEFPRQGYGIRSFTDFMGCNWYADFGNTVYNYDKMPAKIDYNATEDIYGPAATLIYHAGVAMHDEWRTGAREGVVRAFTEYFKYSKRAKFLYRNDFTPEQWDKVFKSELSLGRPIGIGGDGGPLPEGGVAGHWFICDGYNADNLFHIRWDYGADRNEYLPLYEIKPFHVNNRALMNLEPELNSKSVELLFPAGNENLKQATFCNLQWNSLNVNNIKIEFSDDDGANWTTIVESAPASIGNYTIALPAVTSRDCKIRISDCNDINVYSRNRTTFALYDTKELNLQGNIPVYVQQGTTLPVRWDSKGVGNLRVEYTTDNGMTWSEITEVLSSLNIYRWKIPDIVSSNCRIRLTDMSDDTFTRESDAFAIGINPMIGGPYKTDNATVALVHFDTDYYNDAAPTDPAVSYNSVTFEENFESGLDYCAKIDNSSSSSYSCVILNDNEQLQLLSDWTIEFWFKINSWGGVTTEFPFMFFKPGANYFVILNMQSKTLSAGYDYEGGSKSVILPENSLVVGKWYHLTFIRNVNNSTLLCCLRDVNRNLLVSASVDIDNINLLPKVTSEPLRIGGYNFGSNVQFDGWIDELRISNVVRDFTTVSNKEENFSQIICYPNPVTDKIMVSGISDDNSIVNLINVNGQIIYSVQTYQPGNVELNLDKCQAGVYYIQVVDNNAVVVRKIIKK